MSPLSNNDIFSQYGLYFVFLLCEYEDETALSQSFVIILIHSLKGIDFKK